ncbi:hypothetical protein VPH35_028920 [Triticum aestivum]|uniref:Uncharacterized protein n=1 Tax=Triticum turgidum subsp. durum TaxID=4567 RepID=A0A9R1PNE3_TRITD|nr:unnamed protein product [Triticum turgidum subsp. durum]
MEKSPAVSTPNSPSEAVLVLRAALRDTLGEAVSAVGAVAGLASLSNHAREEMVVRNCIELLGYSVDELGWSLNAMAEPLHGAEPEMETAHGAAPRSVRRGRTRKTTCRLPRHRWPPAASRRGVRGAANAAGEQPPRHAQALLRRIMPLRQHGNNDTAASGAGSELPTWVMDVAGVVEEELKRAQSWRDGSSRSPRGRWRWWPRSARGPGRAAGRVELVQD